MSSPVSRAVDLKGLLERKSLFLFGPRSTGKTTLIRQQLGERCTYIDLLKSRFYTELLGNPGLLEDIIAAHPKKPVIVIDEIQKVPALLDEVHRLIEEKKFRFLLTGSSARSLKRKDANLLGGRAWRADLFPLTSHEIAELDLSRALRFGSLPSVWFSNSPNEELDAYVSIYLKEEIEREANVRNLPAFARFLKIAALSSGQLINFARMASDSSIPQTTLKAYFQILQDTLIGFQLEPFDQTTKRKAIATAKFYLFDNGVRHALLNTESLDRNSDLYGSSFEAFIGQELRAYLSYRRIKKELTYWRSTSGFEVDFLAGTQVAIEVKASTRITERALKGLSALSEEGIHRDYYLVSQDPVPRTQSLTHGTKATLLPWRDFLERLWAGNIIS